MAQGNANIPNSSGAVFRSGLNDRLLALFTQHSGNAAPVTTYAFQPWVDSSTSPPTYKMRNAANTGWITIGQLDSTFKVGGTVAIANGGTGQTTASAAINALVPSQSGNSGKALTTDGSVVSWGSAGAASKTELFTSSGSWVCPDGVTYVTACVIGGGGGGGAAITSYLGGYGGPGGVGIGCIAVTPGTTYTVTIGSGGTGSNSGTGSAGGSTTFSSITATGGAGGPATSGTTTGYGAAGSCSSTDANLARGNIQSCAVPYITRFASYTSSTATTVIRAIECFRDNNSATAIAWAATAAYSPGSGGVGEDNGNDTNGGVGGAVLLTY